MLSATATAMIQKLREVALPLEFSTIPPYLYAMYSIKPEDEQGKEARDKFREIFLQEMLHLALVGNLMSTLQANPGPCLYDKMAVPIYPNDVGYDQIELNLEAANEANLKRFVRIEAPLPVHVRDNPSPWKPPVVTLNKALEGAASAASAASMTLLADSLMQASKVAASIEEQLSIAPNYQSIGDVYAELDNMVHSLDDQDFRGAPNEIKWQFENNFHSRHEVFAITNKNDAHAALQKVREQGEGGGAGDEYSHYVIFQRLLATFRSTPWKLYKVPKNPTTAEYPAGSYIRKLSSAFDAAYCYLLKNIESIWDVNSNIPHSGLFINIRRIMSDVLTPLANILVLQPFGDGCAAPCFNYYTKGGRPLTLTQLHSALQEELEGAIRRVPTEGVISIAAGHALKTAGEAIIFLEPAPDSTTLLDGVTALRASVIPISTPSMEHAEEAVDAVKKVIEVASKNAHVDKKAADAARNVAGETKKTADDDKAAHAAEKADATEKAANRIVDAAREASLYLDQKAELREILNRVQNYIKPNP